jgi:hypothetical protein
MVALSLVASFSRNFFGRVCTHKSFRRRLLAAVELPSFMTRPSNVPAADPVPCLGMERVESESLALTNPPSGLRACCEDRQGKAGTAAQNAKGALGRLFRWGRLVD